MKELLAPYGIWPLVILCVLLCATILISFSIPYKGRPSQWPAGLALTILTAIGMVVTFWGDQYLGIGMLVVGFVLLLKFVDRILR